MNTHFKLSRKVANELLSHALWDIFPKHKLDELGDTSFVMRNYVEALSDSDVEDIFIELEDGAVIWWFVKVLVREGGNEEFVWQHEFYRPSSRSR